VKSSPRRRLAASFVVTVSASASAVAGLEGCRKQTVGGGGGDDRESGNRSAYVFRAASGECLMSQPMSCPKNVSCNPPPPESVDCPVTHRDAGDPPPTVTRRPPGKEDWVRVRPRLYASQYGCSYNGESFCAPPGKPWACVDRLPPVTLKCAAVSVDAGVDAAETGARPSAAAISGR